MVMVAFISCIKDGSIICTPLHLLNSIKNKVPLVTRNLKIVKKKQKI